MKNKILFDNHEFESYEELHIYWFAMELMEQKYIDHLVYQPKTKELSSAITRPITIQMKTKINIGTRQILDSHNYTPDYIFHWTDKAYLKYFQYYDQPMDSKCQAFFLVKSGENKSIIEVKGTFDRFNMIREFKVNQKWIFDKFRIYVQMVVPKVLFVKTFYPQRYRFTDSGKHPRKI